MRHATPAPTPTARGASGSWACERARGHPDTLDCVHVSTIHPRPRTNLTAEELADYVLDLGGTLLSYGCSTHRLEALISVVCRQEGFQSDVFAVPTGIWMSIRAAHGPPVTRMMRVKEWGVDLARLTAVDRVWNDVLERKLTLSDARAALDHIEAAPPPYPPGAAWLAASLAAAAAAVFFRGGWPEIVLAAFGGLLLGFLRSLLLRWPRTRLLVDFLGGLVAGALAWSATAIDPRLSREVLVLSMVILLVPGMALTSGLQELVHKDLVSGASRLMEAMMTFLSILCGIAAIVGLERLLGTASGGAAAAAAAARGHSLPLVVQAGALLASCLAFAVLFSVPRRLLATAFISGGTSWVVTTLATRSLPASLSAFAASLAVCLVANGLARLTDRPAQLYLMPGLVLLVPGSFGFRSLEAFLRGELIDGAAQGFEMFLTAGAIVTGLLVGTALLPARKLL